MIYDVVIVGAGAAGASAALELSKSALSVLVIEKESLPRVKPCGGAMPASVLNLIDIDISEVIKNRVPIIDMYHNYADKVSHNMPKNQEVVLVERSEFDFFLLKKAKERALGSIEVREKQIVENVFESKESVTVLLKGGEKIEGKYLIGADGPLGKVAAAVGLMKKKKFAPTLEAEITLDKDTSKLFQHKMVMNYFCLPHGYGWIFPKEKNKFSCGVGSWQKSLNLRKELSIFLSQSLPHDAIESMKVRGYPIPIYQGDKEIATQRVYLAGDAAALVNPVTGEGIRFAVHSGKLASLVIMRALQAKNRDRKDFVHEYYERIENEIGQELKYKLGFEFLAFHNNPALFYKKFIK